MNPFLLVYFVSFGLAAINARQQPAGKTFAWYHNGKDKNGEVVLGKDWKVQSSWNMDKLEEKQEEGTWEMTTGGDILWKHVQKHGTHRLVYNEKLRYWELREPLRSPPSLMKEIDRICIGKERRDMVIVLELPPGGVPGISRFQDLLENLMSSNECMRAAVILAYEGSYKVVKQFDEEFTGKRLRAYRKIIQQSWGKRKCTAASLRRTKLNFAKAISSVKPSLFNAQTDKLDAKSILLVSTIKKQPGITLSEYAGELHEGSPTAKVIAVLGMGIGERDAEDELISLTRNKGRLVQVKHMRELRSKTSKKLKKLNTLVKQPESFDEKVVKVKPTHDLVYKETVEKDEICTYIADLAFLIDSSGSLKEDFHKVKYYVQRIANRYRVEKDGTHAGTVVFSDFLPKYTKLDIKFTDHDTTDSFNLAVANTPHYNFRTRIDLGFKVAEEQLFVKEAGMRPDLKKLIFLVTDGKQNPIYDDFNKSIKLDPVEASKNLYDNEKVDIFIVAVGPMVNETELRKIARSENGDRVMRAKDLDHLISDEFVRNSAKSSCRPARSLQFPVAGSMEMSSCPENTKSGSCCETKNTVVNIFQDGSHQTNYYDGKKAGGNDDETLRNVSKNDVDNLVQAVKDAMGSQEKIDNVVNEFVKIHGN